ncbi:MAG: hypothetical protein ACTJGR_08215, partial [Pauljensenia sp.]
MTTVRQQTAPALQTLPGPRGLRRRLQRRGADGDEGEQRRVLSSSDWRRPAVKWVWRGMHFLLLVLLVVFCVGPILLLVKFAFTPTQDIQATPLEF